MPATKNGEERLARLEELCFFQESTIAGLNEALTRQQFQMDMLEKRLLASEECLRQLREMLDEGGETTLPPHSVPGLY